MKEKLIDIKKLCDETLRTREDRYSVTFNEARGKITIIDWYKNKARVFD